MSTIGSNNRSKQENSGKLANKPIKSREARLYRVEAIASYLDRQIPLITPNQRLASRIKTAWNHRQAGAGLKSWQTADITAIEHWFQTAWQHYVYGVGSEHAGKRVLNQYAKHQLWQSCIKSSPRGLALLKLSATAQQAASAYKTIKLWQLDMDSQAVRQQFVMDEDCSEFICWFDEFELLCEKQNCITPERCIELMLEDSLSLSFEELVLVEFEDIPPLYRAYFSAKVSRFREYHDREKRAQSFAFACDDEEGEIYAAASWVKDILGQQADATIGFIHPQLAQQRSRVERIFSEVLDPAAIAVEEDRYTAPFNFSAGVELSQCPPVKVAIQMLGLLLPEVGVEQIVSVLGSRYCATEIDDLNGRSAIIKALHDGGAATVNGSSLRYLLQNTQWRDIDQQHSGIDLGDQVLSITQTRMLAEQQLPSLWGQRVAVILEQLGWPGAASLDSVEYQQVEHWYTLLADLESIDDISGKLGFQQFLNFLQQLLSETIFQAKTPDSPIQILGLLEGAGLQFSHLWVAGMGHLDWPPAANPSPFLPIGIQRSMAMPHADADREYHFSSQLLDRFSHSADHLCFSYVNIRDGIEQKLSGMLSDVKEISVDGLFVNSSERPYLSFWKKFTDAMQFEDYIDGGGPLLSAEEKVRGGSALLEDQSACAFRAFAKYRLGAESLGELQPALTSMDRGILMHDALFRLWGNIENSTRLAEIESSELTIEIEGAVGSAIKSFLKSRRFQIGEKYLDIERKRLVRLLEEWMSLERQREQFSVVAREEAGEFELGPLKISLRIDRIDEMPDGGKLLIDYKSGNSEVKHWLGQRPEKPQLPLYAFVEGDDISAIAYGYVKAEKSSFIGISDKTNFSEIIPCDDEKALQKRRLDWQGSWQELKGSWQQYITALAQEFIDGNAEVYPSRGMQTCRYCDLAAVCRKHEVMQ